MNQQLTLPANVSVALLQLRGQQARRWWAPGETNDMSQQLADSALVYLRAASRVQRAEVMPALVVGEQHSIAALREAAARLQADLLLVYRPSCRLYERAPFLGALQWRATCTLEAVALETRSGLLPFSAVITRDQVTQRERGEFEDLEAQRRAEVRSMLLALHGIVDRLTIRLAGVPVRNP